ncbi:MAG TPA: S8 family serine peptidase [Gemmatimonadales bacterium]|nr:S8 family serine peptidase [Gemmatimonadales bacterium]
MKQWLIAATACFALVACEQDRQVAGPEQLSATVTGSDAQIYIVNFDETQTTEAAVTAGILNAGAGAVQFNNFSMVAALATPAQLVSISGLPGLEGIYANKQLEHYMLHESVPSIRADAVHVAGITGKDIGVAILDSGIDGLYNPDVAYPQYTVANVKVLYNQDDLFTFGKDAPKPVRKGATLVTPNIPNSETSVGHGTHVAGIVGGRGTASNGYYTGVAPGANLIGIGTGDVLFVFFALAGFDYILDHQQQYNIKVVNNSWGTTGAFDPKDPVNEATKKLSSRGITVVFAAGNEGPGQNTLNPYSVAPWVISVAATCKIGVADPTNSADHCMLDDGSDPLEPTDNEPRAHVLADFSSRGIPGDALYHPDISAPGVHIVSTRAATGTVINALDANHDARICNISALTQPFYTCASGTSMAAPHIAGVVALMQEAAGGRLSPAQVLSALTSTARPLPEYATWEVGAGFVDAYAAVMKVKR